MAACDRVLIMASIDQGWINSADGLSMILLIEGGEFDSIDNDVDGGADT
jgi:hypothetical protein